MLQPDQNNISKSLDRARDALRSPYPDVALALSELDNLEKIIQTNSIERKEASLIEDRAKSLNLAIRSNAFCLKGSVENCRKFLIALTEISAHGPFKIGEIKAIALQHKLLRPKIRTIQWLLAPLRKLEIIERAEGEENSRMYRLKPVSEIIQ